MRLSLGWRRSQRASMIPRTLRVACLLCLLITSTGWAQLESAEPAEGLNIWGLLQAGGYWMLPILLMSLLVGTVTFERLIGLRKSRILPSRLAAKLRRMSDPASAFDPDEFSRLCQNHPSSAATVVRYLLLKMGRPHFELEQAIRDGMQREATRLHGNVRWLNLAAAVTPLMGLMGTVWGMIRAFHGTTQLMPEQDRAVVLGEGIYVALVTTLAGLVVAIPAAIFAHFFEGRIQSALARVEELLVQLKPRIEDYEGPLVTASRRGNTTRRVSETLPVQPPPVQIESETDHPMSRS